MLCSIGDLKIRLSQPLPQRHSLSHLRKTLAVTDKKAKTVKEFWDYREKTDKSQLQATRGIGIAQGKLL